MGGASRAEQVLQRPAGGWETRFGPSAGSPHLLVNSHPSAGLLQLWTPEMVKQQPLVLSWHWPSHFHCAREGVGECPGVTAS